MSTYITRKSTPDGKARTRELRKTRRDKYLWRERGTRLGSVRHTC